MRVIMVMFDSLNRNMLGPYGGTEVKTPHFDELARRAVTFEQCYAGSLPCMPARRELHTGRYNFLHRNWGPLEPFDDSMPELLNHFGIHSHLATDHYHYFEDGGATYHTRYRTWEGFRGQEGDAWKGVVTRETKASFSRNRCDGREDSWEHNWVSQDFINRSYQEAEAKQPQSLTFEAGKEFIRRNHDADQWFLQIETFDPHEPFFTQERYRRLYPDGYEGPVYDWPDYRSLDSRDTLEDIRHLRAEYAALLTMCDEKLGDVLRLMDEYQMWEDTMLIVGTDHGFLLSEHGQWAKCHCPFYNEVARIPLFIWDPLTGKNGCRVKSLVQTIDIPATILSQFGIDLPEDMEGIPLQNVLRNDVPIRQAALFGIYGGQINCTDGRYVYMRSPVRREEPIYQYTLMPTGHGGRNAFLDRAELRQMTLCEGFSFTKGIPVMKIPYNREVSQIRYETMLFDLEQDPNQEYPIRDEEAEQRLKELMTARMRANDCPEEIFVRYGL